MKKNRIIEQTICFVKQELENAEGGHGWQHVFRVWKNSKEILKTENANKLVVELAALLHDIADSKFYNGDETVGPKKAHEFLTSENIDNETIQHVIAIIENISFKNSLGKVNFHSKELEIVQDADRLDAIGAIGVARCFNYGGFKNNKIYSPDIPPKLNMTKEEYKKSESTSINHFYEKLLLLKDKMNTATGKKLAIDRHKFMEQYLEQFHREIGD